MKINAEKETKWVFHVSEDDKDTEMNMGTIAKLYQEYNIPDGCSVIITEHNRTAVFREKKILPSHNNESN